MTHPNQSFATPPNSSENSPRNKKESLFVDEVDVYSNASGMIESIMNDINLLSNSSPTPCESLLSRRHSLPHLRELSGVKKPNANKWNFSTIPECLSDVNASNNGPLPAASSSSTTSDLKSDNLAIKRRFSIKDTSNSGNRNGDKWKLLDFIPGRFSIDVPSVLQTAFSSSLPHAPISAPVIPSPVPAQQQNSFVSSPTRSHISLNCFLIQFTSGRTDTYYVPSDASFPVVVGDYVVVEADRGEDLGRVIMNNINVPVPTRMERNADDFCDDLKMPSVGGGEMQDSSFLSNNNFPKQVYRVAEPVEIESLLSKVKDEINAISVGQYKVQEWKLPMTIIDAEYQWDRRKLTFFFSIPSAKNGADNNNNQQQYFHSQAQPRVDFRTLIRDLYQIYRTRIWMYCVDKDKNRSNRAHNREKFLKQLFLDVLYISSTSTPSERDEKLKGKNNKNKLNNLDVQCSIEELTNSLAEMSSLDVRHNFEGDEMGFGESEGEIAYRNATNWYLESLKEKVVAGI
jgi:cell fate regulator YaaT (PSP1 superfamily)